jgi:hypothetical protein
MSEHHLTIGAHVYCADGKFGKLTRVAIEPDTWQVTDLIVEEGFLLKCSRVFPISLVSSATGEEIHLSIGEDALASFQQYSEEEFEVFSGPWKQFGPPGSSIGDGETVVHVLDHYGLSPSAVAPIVRRKVRTGVAEELATIEKGTNRTLPHWTGYT